MVYCIALLDVLSVSSTVQTRNASGWIPKYFKCFSNLNAGGDLPYDALANLDKRQDREFVSFLMSTNAHKNVAKWSGWGTFIDAVRFLDDRTALTVVWTMLGIHTDLNFRAKRLNYRDIYPATVVDAAARYSNVEMIEILLKSGALVTYETLFSSIMSGNHILIRLLLDRGANVNSHH